MQSAETEDCALLIYEPSRYVDVHHPRSFLLSAGAGSGKTRAVVDTVREALSANEKLLRVSGSQIAVITFTRKARDEISRRLGSNQSVSVSTVHSFAWKVIQPHTQAIKEVLEGRLAADLKKTLEAQAKGKPGAAAESRVRKIQRIQDELDRLPLVKSFSYSPERDLPEKGELGHHDVFAIFEELLESRPLLGQILVAKYPILLIDEAQDTSKKVLPSLINLSTIHSSRFTLGLFGDTMQKVYLDGVPDLQSTVPDSWEKPQLTVNYRSVPRIVKLANDLRNEAGLVRQIAASSHPGFVRFFAADIRSDRQEVESVARERMVELSGDVDWISADNGWSSEQTKLLVLEHSLAAERAGFSAFFSCFTGEARSEIVGQSAHLGTVVGFLAAIKGFLQALRDGRMGKADQLLAELRSTRGSTVADEQNGLAEEVTVTPPSLREAALKLLSLSDDSANTSIRDLLGHIEKSKLFPIPERVGEILTYDRNRESDTLPTDDIAAAWQRAFGVGWVEASTCIDYIRGRLAIDTQQGVKGLEFERVMVVLDDSQSGGKTFNFDRLIGLTPPSDTDLRNIASGKETTADRTRRVFYVACTRAKVGLAVVHYSSDPSSARERVIEAGWFSEGEIETI